MSTLPSLSAASDISREDTVQLYWPRMFRAASGYESNPAMRDELAQEMAFAVWRALANFSGESSLNTYVYRVIHNVAVDHIRSSRRQITASADSISSEEVFSDLCNPELDVAQTQQSKKLMLSIQKLPLSLRQVMLLKLEDLSNIEIAETLGLSESNVAVRINRSKQQLIELMQDFSE